jgi:nicotinate-nucleotide adenylyltransferase
MNLALFGGTFDPVHRGHLAIARAAQQKFNLKKIYFVPAAVPPHKQKAPRTPFHHRYAMLALATAGEKTFFPSLLEAPPDGENGAIPIATARARRVAAARPSYTIDTVRRVRSGLRKSDRLFFLLGIDVFQGIATWREPESLLRECEFIVASRPGFSLADLAASLPESMRPSAGAIKPFARQKAEGELAIGGAMIHLLPQVEVDVSATLIRSAAAHGRSLARYVEPLVAEYIQKMHLYKR